MAYAMTKQGSLDNCVTYEFICDTIEDMNAIEDRYRTLGSIAIVLSGTSGLEVYIAGSDKQWNSLSSIGANSGSGGSETIVIDGGGFTIHICSSSEVRIGRPNISAPDEKTIYLVPAEDASGGNLYDEYIYVNNKWEKFGSGGNIDLSDYVTYQDLDNADLATHNDLRNYAALDDNDKVSMEQLPLPTISSDDNGKILQVGSGELIVDNLSYNFFEPKTWTGLTDFYGKDIWTDGENIYYNAGPNTYILDKATATWQSKTWNGLENFDFGGTEVWTDGENIYCSKYSYTSNASYQYVLDKTTSTWSKKIWNGLTNFNKTHIWTDGEDIYYSWGYDKQYVLDKSTSTWNTKTWNGITNIYGSNVWTDGENIYYTSLSSHYILDKTTSTWRRKAWQGPSSISNTSIWTDGENYYYSSGSTQYILQLKEKKVLIGTKGEFNLITSVKDFLSDRAPIESPNFIGSISMGRVANSVIGESSTALGNGVIASGSYSHAEGGGAKATDYAAHAEGGGTTASGSSSHAEGGGTTASGNCSHAEGGGTRATKLNAHAEGGGTTASGGSSHAEGGSTTASGDYSHAEGSGTTASGNASHAEGGSTIAAGSYSHVSGKYNTADSYDNWPEWTANTAYAVGDKVKITSETTVEGYICKIANNDNVFTKSHWADTWNQMNYVEIIGNGDAVDARSNARALDWDGNEHLMGDIYVGCNADSTGGIKLPRIPEAPSTDGTYTLQVTVTNGTPTYSWISVG